MPLFWLSLAFLGGILLGELLNWSLITWLALAGFTLFLALLRLILVRRFPALVPRPLAIPLLRVPYSLLLAALFLGAARYQSVQPTWTPDDIAWYNDRPVEYVVEGVLVRPADERERYANLRLEVDHLRPVGETSYLPVDGMLLVQVPPGGGWDYGDRLQLQGMLKTPPENEEFSYRDYLARQGMYSIMSYPDTQLLERDQGNKFLAAIYNLKSRLLEMVYQLFPEPEASLLAGILLGVESRIPEDLEEAFRDTGTAHIVVISGFNITIVAGLFAVLFGALLGKRLGALAAVLAIAVYTLLVGAEAAVVRAALMGGLSLFAAQVGRRQDGLNTLAFVAALMALINPMVLWDVGFQLSFTATLGLVLYAKPLTEAFTRFATRYTSPQTARRLAIPVEGFLFFTLAAQLTLLPVVAYHFRQVSLISLLANPAVLPAQPPVMVLGGLAVLLGVLYQPLGQWVAYLAWPFVAYTIRAVEFFARWPLGVISFGDFALVWVAVFYAVLLGLTFRGNIRNWISCQGGQPISGTKPSSPAGGTPPAGRLPTWFPSFALGFLGVATVLVWRTALSAPDGKLHLTVLDVGSGDALLVQSPTGRFLLVDGGPSASRLSDALGRRLLMSWRKLDYLVVAAGGDEQVAALPASLESFPPGNVLWAGPDAASYNSRRLQEQLSKDRVPVESIRTGQVLELGGGAKLHVLAAGQRGSVLLLEWGDFRTLLPVGLDFESMEALQADLTLTPVTALLLADSGYAPLSPPEWIARWQPQVVLLSVGAGDKLGRPDPETLAAVEGYTLLRTDQNGWIELSTDGEQLWVEAERR